MTDDAPNSSTTEPEPGGPKKRWWNKKQFLVPALLVLAAIVLGTLNPDSKNDDKTVRLTNENQPLVTASTATAPATTSTTQVVVPNTTSTTAAAATTTTAQHVSPATTAAPPAADSYTNVDGQHIESPDANTSGATGVCRDGSYTHATHHQGACSSHGGVDHWL